MYIGVSVRLQSKETANETHCSWISPVERNQTQSAGERWREGGGGRGEIERQREGEREKRCKL